MPGPDGAPAPPRPRLKLNPSRSSSFAVDSNATSLPSAGGGGGAAAAALAAASPTVATPRTESQRKVTLKIHSSAPPTPLEPPQPTKTKAGRQPKPSQKVVENKKRPLEDDEDAPLAASAHRQHHQPPKKKLSVVRPVIKTGGLGVGGGAKQLLIKQKGRPPVHPPGDGYDSEASDRERDPHIEEQLVLRMMPGEHADYVRWCIENGKVGVSKAQGGADLQIKFFEEDGRRAVVAVKGQPYAAVMVDLPTITEAMKTWDRKSFMKSADICQMLLVFQKVKNDDEAKKVPLPKVLEGNSHFKWPHGLTPPMHDAVNRRFAKTISRKEIEDKEAEVERLLADDAKAASTKWEWVDDRQNEGEEEEEEEEEEDAEGEVDESGFFGTDAGDDIADVDLEADLEAAFADEFMAETPVAGGITAETPMTSTQVGTPDVVKDSVESEEDEEEDDDDDDDDDDEDLDDDERAQRDEEQGIKDIISDMQKQLAQRRADWERTNNQILRSRIEAQIKQLKSEIELKMSSIGMEMDD